MTPAEQNHAGASAGSIGLLAEYATAEQLIDAARSMRLAGYAHLDAHTPFPIHELDEALDLRPSPLPWVVLVAGVLGGAAALAFQWWSGAVDYAIRVSGKPLFSLPANIPVTFEVIILAAGSAAFFGMLALNGLPQLANRWMRSESFSRATSDGFFLSLENDETNLDGEAARRAMLETGAVRVESVPEGGADRSIPRSIWLVLAATASLCLLPPAMIASVRSTTSDKPRLHNFFNMDFQPKFKAQSTSTLFADGRAMRPRVVGTIPRGALSADPSYEFGLAEMSFDDGVGGEDADGRRWIGEAPVTATREMMDRGRERFGIHCAVCHGQAGYGNGLASLRALELEQGTWVPPTSLHAEHVIKQPDGQLFGVITNGVRKMPAYGHQIPVEDRWAIVLYMRALQRSQNASLEDVPEQMRPILRERN